MEEFLVMKLSKIIDESFSLKKFVQNCIDKPAEQCKNKEYLKVLVLNFTDLDEKLLNDVLSKVPESKHLQILSSILRVQNKSKFISIKKLTTVTSGVYDSDLRSFLPIMVSLHTLSINDKIPKNIVKLPNLKTLKLSNIKSLPKEIFSMKSLTSLIITNSSITKLPIEIGNSNLEILKITNSNLTSLTREIGNLKKLKILDLTNNNLTSIPSEIGQLINLISLSLYNNKIKELPNSIGNLKKLEKLFVGGNPIVEMPFTIVNLKHLDKKNIFKLFSKE